MCVVHTQRMCCSHAAYGELTNRKAVGICMCIYREAVGICVCICRKAVGICVCNYRKAVGICVCIHVCVYRKL